MDCRKLESDQAFLLASGGMSKLRAMLVRHHVAQCAPCRRRYDDAKLICAKLSEIASEPVSEQVLAAVFAAIPSDADHRAGSSLSDITIGGRYKVKKLTLVLAGAVLLIGVAAAMAPRLNFGHMEGSVGMPGHQWRFEINQKVRIQVYDANNQLLGTLADDSDDSDAPVDLTVAGQHFQVTGYGRHEIRSQSGDLIGTVDLEPETAQQVQDDEKKVSGMPSDFLAATAWAKARELSSNGTSGAAGGVASSYGFNRAQDVFWYVRGIATVAMLDPQTGRIDVSASSNRVSAQILANLPAQISAQLYQPGLDNPQIAITAGDKTTYDRGFGKYRIADSSGRLLFWLVVKPNS
jgi:hypothetical protein